MKIVQGILLAVFVLGSSACFAGGKPEVTVSYGTFFRYSDFRRDSFPEGYRLTVSVPIVECWRFEGDITRDLSRFRESSDNPYYPEDHTQMWTSTIISAGLFRRWSRDHVELFAGLGAGGLLQKGRVAYFGYETFPSGSRVLRYENHFEYEENNMIMFGRAGFILHMPAHLLLRIQGEFGIIAASIDAGIGFKF